MASILCMRAPAAAADSQLKKLGGGREQGSQQACRLQLLLVGWLLLAGWLLLPCWLQLWLQQLQQLQLQLQPSQRLQSCQSQSQQQRQQQQRPAP